MDYHNVPLAVMHAASGFLSRGLYLQSGRHMLE